MRDVIAFRSVRGAEIRPPHPSFSHNDTSVSVLNLSLAFRVIFILNNYLTFSAFCIIIKYNLGNIWEVSMDKRYTLKIGDITRELPLCKVNDNLYIAAFILFGDVELTRSCAEQLLALAPPFDILMTAEAKSIPLIYEMARQCGHNDYIVARKRPKLYMKDIISVNVRSITTTGEQTLCLGSDEVEKIKGKRVLLIDDVISTGESLEALIALVIRSGGSIAGKMAVLAEGDAAARGDIITLAPLPFFDGEGREIKK